MRAVVEAIAVIARKTLICPTLFTRYTPKRHPIVNPRKYAAPINPIEVVENDSTLALIGNNVPCSP
jgi:hypothetical protein